MQEHTGTESELARLAGELLSGIHNKFVILSGELGAGKTTLVRHMLMLLGGGEVATSPTFSIHNSYSTPKGTVLHSDLYRLKSLQELENTGFFELAEEAEFVFIEWGEKFDLGKLLGQHSEIRIIKNKDKRDYILSEKTV